MVIANDNRHPIAEKNPGLTGDQAGRLVARVRLQKSFLGI